MLKFISYARNTATPQMIEDEYRGYWLILNGDEFVDEGRTTHTFTDKENAIESADSLMAAWYEDYQLAEANNYSDLAEAMHDKQTANT